MEFTVNLKHGPLEVEIQARDEDDYQTEILSLIEFIEENEETLGKLNGAPDSVEHGGNGEVQEDLSRWEGISEEENVEAEDDEEPTTESAKSSDSPLFPISSRLNLPLSDLEEVFHVVPEEDNMPVLFLDNTEQLSSEKKERQRKTSLMLLYLWHSCYEVDRVSSSDLKEALTLSNISDTNISNMYLGEGDRLFDRTGRGASATVALTPPGKRQAQKEFRKLMESLEE